MRGRCSRWRRHNLTTVVLFTASLDGSSLAPASLYSGLHLSTVREQWQASSVGAGEQPWGGSGCQTRDGINIQTSGLDVASILTPADMPNMASISKPTDQRWHQYTDQRIRGGINIDTSRHAKYGINIQTTRLEMASLLLIMHFQTVCQSFYAPK